MSGVASMNPISAFGPCSRACRVHPMRTEKPSARAAISAFCRNARDIGKVLLDGPARRRRSASKVAHLGHDRRVGLVGVRVAVGATLTEPVAASDAAKHLHAGLPVVTDGPRAGGPAEPAD